ncbi:MAG: NAD-dependent epimerase/dehydratase family protein [Bacteroidales bacterium]|nr:NAD-dependent epimerase/dehydratase family protein [Bacteroidales bacterium]
MSKNILITGSEGFIGQALKKKIKKEFPEYRIFGFDIQDGDISTTEPAFDHIDHVFHLAGKTYIPKSWEEPLEFYKTNVTGTNIILEFCRKRKASLTYISAYVYGMPEFLPISEKHSLNPNNPYMHSKILAESLCRFYARHYNVKITILRPFNVFGAGQSSLFLIPLLIDQLLSKDKDILVVKDIRPKRDFIYIEDLLNAIILTLREEKRFEIYNVGSGISISIKEIIEILKEITNINKSIKTKGEYRNNEILDVRADINKIKNQLGWKPKYSFREGMIKTIELIKKNGM